MPLDYDAFLYSPGFVLFMQPYSILLLETRVQDIACKQLIQVNISAFSFVSPSTLLLYLEKKMQQKSKLKLLWRAEMKGRVWQIKYIIAKALPCYYCCCWLVGWAVNTEVSMQPETKVGQFLNS